jgi:hypothetical protein
MILGYLGLMPSAPRACSGAASQVTGGRGKCGNFRTKIRLGKTGKRATIRIRVLDNFVQQSRMALIVKLRGGPFREGLSADAAVKPRFQNDSTLLVLSPRQPF